jgi:hypothetical protein
MVMTEKDVMAASSEGPQETDTPGCWIECGRDRPQTRRAGFTIYDSRLDNVRYLGPAWDLHL